MYKPKSGVPLVGLVADLDDPALLGSWIKSAADAELHAKAEYKSDPDLLLRIRHLPICQMGILFVAMSFMEIILENRGAVFIDPLEIWGQELEAMADLGFLEKRGIIYKVGSTVGLTRLRVRDWLIKLCASESVKSIETPKRQPTRTASAQIIHLRKPK